MVDSKQLPDELQRLLELGRAQVSAHPNNDLPRPTRVQIQLALGPYTRSPGVGLTRRTHLCLLVVEKVAGIWERHYPDGPAAEAVQDMLGLTRQRLAGEITQREARRGRGQLVSVLQDSADEPQEKQPAMSAGEAAVRAVYVAMYDEDLEKPELLDDDMDAADWDCAFWGACAWAAAIPGNDGWNQQNQEAYKEYWLWYLNEAIPKAWSSAS